MKITHNKEHCFLAIWALQQYGKYQRVADADDLIEAVLKTKSHKGENWYEMYGKVSINSTEDAVFLNLDFDYGS